MLDSLSWISLRCAEVSISETAATFKSDVSLSFCDGYYHGLKPNTSVNLRCSFLSFTGAAQPGQLFKHLHRAGDLELPADRATVTSHPGSLQTSAERHRSVHDLRQHQSPPRCALSTLQTHEHLPHWAQWVKVPEQWASCIYSTEQEINLWFFFIFYF